MPPVEQLRAARALLAPEGAWCQHALARCEKGRPVHPRSAEAKRRHGIGALRAIGSSLESAELGALQAAAGEVYAVWQDLPGRSQAEVLAVFDRAIAIVRPSERGMP